MFFAAARDGRFPKILNKLSRVQRAPYAALIAQGVQAKSLLFCNRANQVSSPSGCVNHSPLPSERKLQNS
eukprot:2356862-Prorocentrum_lima.AAC.1